MVVTSAPSACTASTLHDFTLVPLRCTVQAPQLLVSQPMTVPVLPTFSRRYCTSSIRGSTSSATFSPSTMRLIRVMDTPLSEHDCGVGHVKQPWLGSGWVRPPARAGPGPRGSGARDREPALEEGYGGVRARA